MVVPGRVRAIRFTEDSRPRIVTWNTIPARPGDILNLRDIEQGLENLKRAPTAEANFEIVPAGPDAKPGESDLLIRYKQGFPFRLGVSYENSGIKATGRYLGTTSLSYDNPLGLSDLFYVSGTLSPFDGDPSPGRTHSYSLGYSVPFRNWSLSFHSDHYEYLQTQSGYLQSYAYSGTQDTMDGRLSYMLYRDAHRKLLVFGGLGVREIHNFVDDTEITVQHRRTSKYSVGFSHREYFDEGFLNAEITLSQGVDLFGALPAPEEASGEGVSHPTIYLASLELDYPFKLGPASLHYHGLANGQYGRQPLASVDRFSIGGRYTVRGFTGDSTLTAENGMVLRNELGLALGKSGQELYAAYDYGFVDGPSARWLPGRSLSGGALGLRGGYKIFSYDVFASVPLSAPKDFPVDHLVCGFRISTEFSIK
jgi:hemolysin activation/secretion protein